MRLFFDTEHGVIITETELAAEFQPSEEYPHLNNWLREIAGKNGTLIRLYRIGYANMYYDAEGNTYIGG